MASRPASLKKGASKPEAQENRTGSRANGTKPLRLSSHYALPHAVKARMDGNYSLANATAIVSTLFAAVMIGMGQIINQESNKSTQWEAVRVLVYGSVIANLAAAMCALWVMAMCSDLPQRAQHLAMVDPNSWPARLAADEDLPDYILKDDYDLLKVFGMNGSYSSMEYLQLVWLIVGLVSMFSAITLWTWVAQTNKVAGVLFIFIIPALLCALYPVWYLIREGLHSLPASIKALADAEYRIASTIAITASHSKLRRLAALFAGVLMSLAQMVINTGDSSAAWEALRFFVYSAISSNLVAAGCCLWTMYALSDLPYKAQQLAMRDKRSWAYRAGNGESFGVELSDPVTLLKDFGADDYWWQSFGAACWYALGLLLTFGALICWIWVSQSKAVAIAVTAVTAPGILGLVYPLADDFYHCMSWMICSGASFLHARLRET